MKSIDCKRPARASLHCKLPSTLSRRSASIVWACAILLAAPVYIVSFVVSAAAGFIGAIFAAVLLLILRRCLEVQRALVADAPQARLRIVHRQLLSWSARIITDVSVADLVKFDLYVARVDVAALVIWQAGSTDPLIFGLTADQAHASADWLRASGVPREPPSS